MENTTSSRNHWTIVSAIAFLICLLRILPYFTSDSSDPNREFLGFAYSIEDTLQYADFVAQGRDGNLFLSNHFSLTSEKPRMIVGCTTVFGLLAKVTGLSIATTWMLLHGLLIVLFFLTLYWFLGAFFESPRLRLFAYLFMAFAGGLDGLVVLLDFMIPAAWLPIVKKSLWPVLGWTPFMATYNPVYLSGLVLLMAFIRTLMRGLKDRSIYLVVACGMVTLLYLNHAYDAAVAIGLTVLLTFYPLLVHLNRRGFLADLKRVSVVLAGAIPVISVALWQSTDHLLSQVTASSHSGLVVSPVLWILGFGAVLLAACYGIPGLKQDNLRSRILFGWLLTGTLLCFMPIFEGRHFLYFVSLPLYILAVDGLLALKARIKLSPKASYAVLAILLIIFCNSFIRVSIRNFTHIKEDNRAYVSQYELAVAAHLKELPLGGVLATRETGMWLPHLTGRRVTMGHWFLTPDMRHQQSLLRRLFSRKTTPKERDRLLRKCDARYLFYGPREQSLGPIPITEQVTLLPLHKVGPTMLFAISVPPASK